MCRIRFIIARGQKKSLHFPKIAGSFKEIESEIMTYGLLDSLKEKKIMSVTPVER